MVTVVEPGSIADQVPCLSMQDAHHQHHCPVATPISPNSTCSRVHVLLESWYKQYIPCSQSACLQAGVKRGMYLKSLTHQLGDSGQLETWRAGGLLSL